MNIENVITALGLAFLLILITNTVADKLQFEDRVEYSDIPSAVSELLVQSRSKRQIPFFSNWFSTNPTTSAIDSTSSKRNYQKSNWFHQYPETFNASLEDEVSPNTSRDSRLLSLFTVVRFDNTQCLSASGDNGTCYPQGECIRRGGAANGKCAQGYGVCCVFSRSCGSSTFQNNTYFTHSGYPTAFDGTGSCQMSIYKSARDVCQYKLEFDSFNIAQPNLQGVCNNDQFIVAGSSTIIPIICGVNTGNHMYVDVGPDNIPVTMSIITSGPAFSRSWKIKVTQIRCPSFQKAPEGCLQYFTGVSGAIRTYNFDFATGAQLANQDYSSCIRQERNFCGIRYSACVDNQVVAGATGATIRSRSFSITGNAETAEAQVGAMCTTDWIVIPCATNTGRVSQGTVVCADRLCGNVFNSVAIGTASPVFSFVRPFRIVYHTNGDEGTDQNNRGYCLSYIQQPCTPPA